MNRPEADRVTPPRSSSVADLDPAGVSAPERRPLVTVIVPAFNEEAVIVDTLRRLTSYMTTLDDLYRWELLVVDDGSSDETGACARAFARDHPVVRVLSHRVNFQLGQALRYAFNESRGAYVVVIDCDLSYDPEHIGRLLRTIEDSRARIVIASPYLRGGTITRVPFARRVMSRWGNRLLALSAAGKLSTITGMVRAYDGRFLRSLDLVATDVDLNTEIIHKAQVLRARIVEIPAHLDWTFAASDGRRRRVKSHWTRTTASTVFSAFIFRPFVAFVVPGLVLLALALYSTGWAVWHVIDNLGQPSAYGNSGWTGAIQNAYHQAPHTFLAAALCYLLAVQLISLGIIAAQGKRYFENLFHLGTSVLRRLPAEPRPIPGDAAAVAADPDDGAAGAPADAGGRR